MRSTPRKRGSCPIGKLHAYPEPKSIRRLMDQVKLTRHSVPLTTKELIEELNPVVGVWATITSGECRSQGVWGK